MIDATCSLCLHTIYSKLKKKPVCYTYKQNNGLQDQEQFFFTESRKEQHFSGISSSDQKCMVEMHYKFHGDMFIHVGDNHSLM